MQSATPSDPTVPPILNNAPLTSSSRSSRVAATITISTSFVFMGNPGLVVDSWPSIFSKQDP